MARDRSKPRGIAARLAGAPRTLRASELENALPSSNVVGGGGTITIGSTRAYPGGPGVVEAPRDVAEHTDDDAHLDVEGELVEPPVLETVGPDGEPVDEGDGEPPARFVAAPGVVDATGTYAAGTYDPAPEGELPGSLEALGTDVRLVDDAPWPAGAWLPYGRGKRAHWAGDRWASGVSPGYPEGGTAQ